MLAANPNGFSKNYRMVASVLANHGVAVITETARRLSHSIGRGHKHKRYRLLFRAPVEGEKGRPEREAAFRPRPPMTAVLPRVHEWQSSVSHSAVLTRATTTEHPPAHNIRCGT